MILFHWLYKSRTPTPATFLPIVPPAEAGQHLAKEVPSRRQEVVDVLAKPCLGSHKAEVWFLLYQLPMQSLPARTDVRFTQF